MIIQISSGIGPVECEGAVTLLYESLSKETEVELLSRKKSSHIKDGDASIIISINDERYKDFNGTIQWACKSPYRPNHKRKNWFIDVSTIPEVENICKNSDFKFEKFRSGGPGGQHVNTTESGVKLIHIPTGISVTSTSERSQFLNKKDCINKINIMLNDMEKENKAQQINIAWSKHNSLVRGNPIRVYTGEEFKRKE